VLWACVAGALVLAAGLVTVQVTTRTDVPALGADQLSGKGGACGSGVEPGGDPVRVATWMSNTSAHPIRVRSIEPRNVGEIGRIPNLRVVIADHAPHNDGTIIGATRKDLRGDSVPARGFTVPGHGGAWVVVDLLVPPNGDGAWVADLAVAERGASGVEHTTIVPALMGVAVTNAGCGRILTDYTR
jgi:hypothetical protein